MIQSAHIRHCFNVGDLACSPLSYTRLSVPHTFIDIREWSDGDVIVGGGGIISDPLIPDLRRISESKNLKIAFGIGANSHHSNTKEYPEFLRKFDLVGIRDSKHELDYATWVPCPSCLNPGFGNPPDRQFDYVIYEHWQKPSPLSMNVPKMRNEGTFRDVKAAIRFLALGDVVITNSYHGAYWGALLGRKVVIHQPFSNRFIDVPWKATVVDGHEFWKWKSGDLPDQDPKFLSICRKECFSFMDRIESLIKNRYA